MGARLPTYFLSHGGGPWPWMSGPMREAHRGLEAELRRMATEMERPRAVLLVSAHWEERAFTLMAQDAPGMLHDYHGFPPETYRVRYASPGAPWLAREAAALLATAGLAVELDTARGYDHGAFVPMHVMFPQADVPLLQLSLRRDLSPAAHVGAGNALAPLREAGVLLLASGSSYHNLRDRGAEGSAPSAAFDAWLAQVLELPDPAARRSALIDWERAPAARLAHPREEHLLPLMVAAGAAGADAARCTWRETGFFGYSTVSNWRFG